MQLNSAFICCGKQPSNKQNIWNTHYYKPPLSLGIHFVTTMFRKSWMLKGELRAASHGLTLLKLFERSEWLSGWSRCRLDDQQGAYINKHIHALNIYQFGFYLILFLEFQVVQSKHKQYFLKSLRFTQRLSEEHGPVIFILPASSVWKQMVVSI